MSRFRIWFLILIVLLIAVGTGIYISRPPSNRSIPPAPTATPIQNQPTPVSSDVKALLLVEKGKAELLSASNKALVSDEHEVIVGDQITTQENSVGMLIFPDNDVLRLAANTKITIVAMASSATESKVFIEQSTGSSWSRVTPFLDRKRQYQIETPTLVATVRGTTFNVSVETAQQSWVGVNESQVDVMRKNDQTWVQVNSGHFASVKTDTMQPMRSEKMDEQKTSSAWFKDNILKDQAMSQMIGNDANRPMPKYFLRDNKNRFFNKTALDVVNSTKPIFQNDSIDFSPLAALKGILNELIEQKHATAEEAAAILQDVKLNEYIQQIKTLAELKAFIKNHIEQLRNREPTSSPTPSQTPSTVTSSPSPTATTTTAPTSQDKTPSPTPSPTSSTSPSPSPTRLNNNFRPTYYYYSPTTQPIR
ncbi:MAG: FecR domain-containing protein [Candidatus Abawacabacteria bacterium]|nr:FecR domain-containing protein [Candidatus Abawacabacteria bacterium]